MRRPVHWIFLAWTVFVWAGRIRNGGSLLLALSFLALAVAAIWSSNALTALVVWTIAVWATRTPIILVHDHPAGFKVVHTVLAVVSVGLAITAQRHVQRERQTATTAARL